MNGLSGINITGLGALAPDLVQKIQKNAGLFDRIMKQSVSGLGDPQTETLSFNQVIELYNHGISENEIQAWVWYKRQLGISMEGWGRKNIDPQKLIAAGALFYCGNEKLKYLPLPVFGFGNMYERHIQLLKDEKYIVEHYGRDVFNNHLEIIEKSKPVQLTITNPEPKERPQIKVICNLASEFKIKSVRPEFLDAEDSRQLNLVNGKATVLKVGSKDKKRKIINLNFDGENEYSLQDVFIKYLFTLDTAEFKNSSATQIQNYHIWNVPLRDDDLTADQKAAIKTAARNEGEMFFSRFLYEVLTPEDQQRLDKVWNEMFNGQSDINYKSIPVGFECSAKFKSGVLQLSPIQREGIAYFQAMGSGICAFDVGVGKTMCAIANLATEIASGKAKRALVVVPKPTYKKWIGEIIGFKDKQGKLVPGVLTGTGITLNDWYNLGTGVKEKIDFTKAVAERSITIVTYEGFKRIGFSDAVGESLFTELCNILGQSSEKTARDKEIEYQKYREMMGMGQKETVCDIDIVGFDYLVIDEAHRCKNVFANVKSDDDGNKRYAMTSAVSETGQKAFLLCNYIQRTYGRSIMLLTATPFTNSPLEIYSMLSLVAYENLNSNSIYNLKEFFDLFVQPTVEWTANYKDEIVEKEVIKSFNNRLVLQKFIYNHILYRTGEEAGVKRPVKVNLPKIYDTVEGQSVKLPPTRQILTYLTPTAAQRINQHDIVESAKAATQGQMDMGALFRALSASLDNALSPYLYRANDRPENYKEFVEGSPKILYACECIRSVKDHHAGLRNRKDLPDILKDCSCQVIYSNRGKQFFPMIKEYLEKEVGFKRGILFENTKFDEVEMLTSEISEIRKENVKEAFLAGAVKVIIGTSTIREGIDLQKRGTVLYDLYPDWNPTDLHQLEGRIWRQGNLFGSVRIVLPLVQDSMDVFVFQKLEEKTDRINDIWYKADRGNVLDVESLDPQELKLALITDVSRITMLYFDQEKKELNREFAKVKSQIDQIDDIEGNIKQLKEYRDQLNEAIKEYYNRLLTLDLLTSPASYDKKEVDKAVKLKKEIEEFLSKTAIGDDEVLNMARKLRNASMSGVWFSERWAIDYFKEYLSKVRKAEIAILKPRGFSLTDDFTPLRDKLNKELAEVQANAARYQGGEKGQGSDRFLELRTEIEAKKEKLAVQGKEPLERMREFAALNYLLEHLADSTPAGPMITPAKPIPASDKEKRIRIARAKAQALLLLSLNG